MPNDRDKYPCWVEPHESHVVLQNERKTAPHFDFWDEDRVSKKFTVLVFDEDDEKRAMSAKEEPKEEEKKDA